MTKITIALCLLVLAASAAGQASATRINHGSNELNIWVGGSIKPITAFSGVTPEEARSRKFFIVGLGYARAIAVSKSLALQYTVDVIPIAIATNDILKFTAPPEPRGTAYGFGVIPLGLRLNFRNESAAKPFVAIGAGGMLFNRPVPLPDAGKFAFALEGGGGIRWFRSSGRAISVGAKLHHLSNGNRSGSNRGLNQLVVYMGFSFMK